MEHGPFRSRLLERRQDPSNRRWVYVPYDQLSDAIGPLSREDPRELGIVLVESSAKAAKRPYHKQKLALVLSNQRHFALEQAARGVAVEYMTTRGDYAWAVRLAACRHSPHRPIRVMRPAERELRVDLSDLVKEGVLEEIPHEGWLTDAEQFEDARKQDTWRMDAFYRRVRRDSGILMDGKAPVGGRFSFDGENRKRWKGSPPAPTPPRFEQDPITEEVAELIERSYARHPGRLDPAALPASAEDARRLWDWARAQCLPTFGPYEDAMSRHSSNLFHTRISSLLNLHRLLPRDVVQDVLDLDIPLASKEGFVRQILGWREFVRHVHEATDGFRSVPTDFLAAARPLPPAFWHGDSGLACLDRVVADVWDEAYSHHITRLMVLCNIANLLDLSPRELTDWFWAAYSDAYEWVVEPNVLGMGTFAAGPLMTTKPYVSGAAYINKMSDYCGDCAFDPASTCPLTSLYWAFLDRHASRLGDNLRMRMPLNAAKRRSDELKQRDRGLFRRVGDSLQSGLRVTPANLEVVPVKQAQS